MARVAPAKPTDGVDYVVGLVGGITAIVFIVTVYCEVTGQPALLWALLLLVLVGATGLLLRHRRGIQRRTQEDTPGDDLS